MVASRGQGSARIMVAPAPIKDTLLKSKWCESTTLSAVKTRTKVMVVIMLRVTVRVVSMLVVVESKPFFQEEKSKRALK